MFKKDSLEKDYLMETNYFLYRLPVISGLIFMFMLGAAVGCDVYDAEPDQLYQHYSEEEVEYFMEIAFGSEYGSGVEKIKKWPRDVRIEVLGSPTPEDEQTLHTVISEINNVTGSVQLRIVDENPSIKMHFVPGEEFEELLPEYVEGNSGFFWISYDSDCHIYEGTVLVSSDDITQKRRSHIIREELTQSLGLMRDSHKYSDSIFYEPWSDVTDFSELDEKLIEMLYRPDIEPCMEKNEVKQILATAES